MNSARVLPRRVRFATCLVYLLASALPVSAAPQPAARHVWPMPEWANASPQDVGLDQAQLIKARDYALTGGGSGIITRYGRVVLRWGDQQQKYDLKSTSKSIGVTALGLAIGDGRLSLEDRASDRHPNFAVPPESNRKLPWREQITLLHLATQTAGFEKPGGYTRLTFAPGTRWSYSDGGPNWLAECVTLAYRRDVADLLFERVFEPIGIATNDLSWRKNAYRDHQIAEVARREFGSGVHANVDAMARIGYLYLRQGRWQTQQLIPADFVNTASQAVAAVTGLPEIDADTYGNASDHYGLLWWNNADGTLANVPRDAYWSWGLYDSLILVIPSLDLVVARAGKSWKRQWDGHYRVLEPFFEPIVQAAGSGTDGAARNSDTEATGKPSVNPRQRDPSPVIRAVHWAPPESIVRLACGSDNWPLTWADDDALYTAYGDGRGFEPFVKRKLSLGLARITGTPPEIRGRNLRSLSMELVGDGARGGKASGMLMVDGVLYMWVRNRDHAQLAYSADHGATWTWCDWRLTTSFGCPTFLNFGRNYTGARDDFVYMYSMDSDTAYARADRMVLARVPKTRLVEREAYEFLERVAEVPGARSPTVQWTREIRRRGAAFVDPGNCYRSSVSYNAGLKRYLWCQTKQGKDTRFRGGFAIYDAPEPWGPWTEVFATTEWDVGPGESSSLPTKWISRDGCTAHLVFSGDDCFSVRRLTFETE